MFKRYTLITYFALANLFLWIAGFLLVKGNLPLIGEWPILYQGVEIEKVRLWRSLLIWTPNFAAIAVLLLSGGGFESIKRLFAQFLKWKVGLSWWSISFGLPLGLAIVSVLVHLSFGGSIELSMSKHLPFVFLLILLQSITESGFGEEAGWRGFALPRLQERFSPLSSSLVVGLMWALWHAPLFYFLNFSFMDVVNFNIMIICLSIIYTWIYNGSGSSLLMIAIIHNTGNSIDVAISTRQTEFASIISEQALGDAFNVVLLVFVLILVLLTKGRLGLKKAEVLT